MMAKREGEAGQARVNFDMTAADLAEVDAAAAAAGQTRAAWARSALLAAARGGDVRLPQAPEGKACACAFVDPDLVAFDRERFRRQTRSAGEAESRLAAVLGPVLEAALSEHPGFGQIAGAAMRDGDELDRALAAAGPGEAGAALAVLRHELDHDNAGDARAWFAPAVEALESRLGGTRGREGGAAL